ncbi:DUF2306 domain-containing protein [Micromonospora sp. NPDC005710]|uniref:DUF2306 domain-containing protein n=1 Tax=Micromonospora sp. NPDC005710 TaxID=3157051 RepID=UPI0033D970BD
MTQNAEKATIRVGRSPAHEAIEPSPSVPPSPRSSSIWRQPYLWLVVLAGAVIFNLLYAFPRYFSTDSANSRSILDPGVPVHYSLVVAHVITGNIAMITVFLQFWGWLRRNHPKIHRISGRVYIFGGALPSAALGVFTLIPLRADHQGSIGIVTMGAAWLATTITGLVMVRKGRYAEHRRWMAYSFALALGTTWGRILVGMFTIWPTMPLPISMIVELANWLGWVLNLVVAHVIVERMAKRQHTPDGTEVITYPTPA